jgi:acyl-CoA reductase-like NAD-dependent aldehyde dehydrogenase
MRSMKREPRKCTFRPVAPLYRFKADDEAIKMTNDTEFKLAAYFLQPRHRAHVARRRGLYMGGRPVIVSKCTKWDQGSREPNPPRLP